MEIRQQKNSNKIRFAFGEEALDYSLEDSSGSRSYSVPYTDINHDRQTLAEWNQWQGSAGMLWLPLDTGLTAKDSFCVINDAEGPRILEQIESHRTRSSAASMTSCPAVIRRTLPRSVQMAT